MSDIEKIAKALNVTVAFLFNEEEPVADSIPLPTTATSDSFIWVPIIDLETCAGNGNGYADETMTVWACFPYQKTN